MGHPVSESRGKKVDYPCLLFLAIPALEPSRLNRTDDARIQRLAVDRRKLSLYHDAYRAGPRSDDGLGGCLRVGSIADWLGEPPAEYGNGASNI
jgi:hypothetical protein